jgi:5-methylcytosine-specific restriction endonuclease McrA
MRAEGYVLDAQRDLNRLVILKGDIARLRTTLDESIVDHGVRVAVCSFPDLTLDGKQTYGPFWESIRREVLERDGYRCQHEDGGCDGPLQIHHIRYLSRGGTNELSNLMTLCRFHHGLEHPDNPAFKR